MFFIYMYIILYAVKKTRTTSKNNIYFEKGKKDEIARNEAMMNNYG